MKHARSFVPNLKLPANFGSSAPHPSPTLLCRRMSLLFLYVQSYRAPTWWIFPPGTHQPAVSPDFTNEHFVFP